MAKLTDLPSELNVDDSSEQSQNEEGIDDNGLVTNLGRDLPEPGESAFPFGHRLYLMALTR